MYEIKKINKVSLAKIMALIYSLAGFFISMGVAISTIANIVTQKDFSGSATVIALFNIGAGLVLSLLAALVVGIFGWVIGYLTAGIYNMFARRSGGIKMELEKIGMDKNNYRQEK